jgi:hypothetical protein
MRTACQYRRATEPKTSTNLARWRNLAPWLVVALAGIGSFFVLTGTSGAQSAASAPQSAQPSTADSTGETKDSNFPVPAQADPDAESADVDAYLAQQGAGNESESQFTVSGDSGGGRMLSAGSDITIARDGIRFIAHSRNEYVSDASGSERLSVRSIEISRPLGEIWKLGGSLGGTSANGFALTPIGSLQADGQYLGAAVSLSASRTMVDSSPAIRHGITVTDMELNASRPIFGDFSVYVDFHRQRYSDANRATSLQIAPQYGFNLLGGWNSLGYRFNYQAFYENSNLYYAPELVLGHQLFWNVSYKSPVYYVSVEIDGGRRLEQAFGTPRPIMHLSGSGSATVGTHVTKKVAVELAASGGNYGLEMPALGWSCVSTTLRLKIEF